MWRKTVFQNKDKILSVERELLVAEATNEAKNKEIQRIREMKDQSTQRI